MVRKTSRKVLRTHVRYRKVTPTLHLAQDVRSKGSNRENQMVCSVWSKNKTLTQNEHKTYVRLT